MEVNYNVPFKRFLLYLLYLFPADVDYLNEVASNNEEESDKGDDNNSDQTLASNQATSKKKLIELKKKENLKKLQEDFEKEEDVFAGLLEPIPGPEATPVGK